MRLSILLLVALIVSSFAFGQQVYDHSQYMFNNLSNNPALAGSKANTLAANLSFRRQWAGLENAPTTALLSAHAPIAKINSGIGGVIFRDVTGPTQKTGLQLAYAYHVLLNDNATLSIGLGGLLMQNNINFSELIFDEQQDNVIINNDEGELGFDFNAGFAIFGDNYMFGMSSLQVSEFQNKFEVENQNALIQYRRHLTMHVLYEFAVSENFDLEPSAQFKYVYGAPVQYNLGLRGIVKDIFWLGIGYRTDDAISALLGVTIKDKFHVGYSYDYTTSSLNDVSNGSHEIMLGFDLNLDKANR